MKIGYKGTDKNMKCRDTQFEVGKTYYIDDNENVKELPQGYNIIQSKVELCTKTALHYCDDLEKVFNHYPDNGKNRFFKVEILGEFKDTSDKSGARCIRFIEEVSREELDKIKQDKADKLLDKLMHIETVKALQQVNPNLIIGGSISLYLQGVRLERFYDGVVDYDITLPFYQKLLSKDGINIDEDGGEDRPSGSDYGETILIDNVKADIRIDPKQKYEIVKHKDFEYKVVPLATIIKAKAEYALTKWGIKHRNDLFEMILNKK